MPEVKSASLRYKILDACFTDRQKRYWSIEELIEKLYLFDIIASRRTLESDFETMRYDERLAIHAPIGYNRKLKGFYYTDPDFAMGDLPVDEDDMDSLALAYNILYQYKDVKIIQQFLAFVDKLGKVIRHVRKPQNDKIIAFDHPPYYKGHEFFDVVLKAITRQQPLRVVYGKFNDNKNDEHVLHPYFLKEYRGRWYVLGYSEARHYQLILGLDRFVSACDADVAFRENKVLKPKAYFQHTLGVTLGKGPVEEIELKFSQLMAPYLKTQHLHHTQKLVSDDATGLVISLRLIPNPELTLLILSYGADVQVLKPEALRNRIITVLEEARRGYS